MQNNCKKKILILANARCKGGISGGDAIYESFVKHWPNCEFTVETMMNIDFRPSVFSYFTRIVVGIHKALFDKREFDLVYSASDFLMDSIPGWIYSRRGYKWIAGFFLLAFIENKKHYYTQKIAHRLIKKHADMVIVTNPTMETIFPNKKTTWINGGISLKLSGLSNEEKIYDAVFCGRLHFSKGIMELLDIWQHVNKKRPNAKLALIGDGDIGIDTIRKKISTMKWNGDSGITLMGYMGDERYEVYKKSKCVLYPTPYKWDHFSMSPVEAMACGCPMLTLHTPVMDYFQKNLGMKGVGLVHCPYMGYENACFSEAIIHTIDGHWEEEVFDARDWAIKFDYEFQSRRVYNSVMGELCDEDIRQGSHGARKEFYA